MNYEALNLFFYFHSCQNLLSYHSFRPSSVSILKLAFFISDVLRINYMKSSKLKSLPDGIVVSGLRAQAAFTSWCWNLLGISFAVTGLLTLFVEDRRTRFGFSNDEMNELPHMQWVLRASVLLFEIAAPLSSLVSFVVTYVLWPKALKGNGSDGLKRIPILIQHNANVIMSLVEVGLLGHLPMRMSDLPLAPLFGIAYVFFSWSVRFHWVPSGDPQFLYFFFDTTLGKTSTIALVILVAILVVFYAIFVLVDDIIAYFGGGFSVHVCVVTTISMLVCRFRN